MKMDQIMHSRDRPIFIQNFTRWRAAASWIWFKRKEMHTRCTRSANPKKLSLSTKHVDRALLSRMANLKLSQLTAAILFPASRPYRYRGYRPIRSLAPMSYASTVMWCDVVSEGKSKLAVHVVGGWELQGRWDCNHGWDLRNSTWG